MNNILVIYESKTHPLRPNLRDHLYSFDKYADARCFYVNLAVRSVPAYLRHIDFDLVVFHTFFLATRWHPAYFRKLWSGIDWLKTNPAEKIALPQDEFLHTDILNEFVDAFRVGRVFSVAPESEWPKIYPRARSRGVALSKVLTGYLDEETVKRIGRLASGKKRTIDIGYRAWNAPPWLGRHGLLKTKIADLFARKAPAKGMTCDISTAEKDVISGEGWYRFLLRCKYFIGAEGGSSILDHDGSLKAATERYLEAHPSADFEEVMSRCFPRIDGNLRLFAISPRHLEACATRTCQLLVEGAYDGILEAGKHYIEIKRDFGNIDEVLKTVRHDKVREAIVDRAYDDIAASGKYSYRKFVRVVLAASLGDRRERPSKKDDADVASAFKRCRAADRSSWMLVRMRHLLRKCLPSSVVSVLRSRKRSR